ncbi:hypothetical protein NDU88_004596 [Pleurodeles waltl]|uniref:Uncharacterized protein n=1 Tax=Pleurodeles waltl TaxID=8319 RepID=A0AAV7V4X1_PLEWA|nr:hypothetical protein NDU88_004596 [Pleurodeles waltl]
MRGLCRSFTPPLCPCCLFPLEWAPGAGRLVPRQWAGEWVGLGVALFETPLVNFGAAAGEPRRRAELRGY